MALLVPGPHLEFQEAKDSSKKRFLDLPFLFTLTYKVMRIFLFFVANSPNPSIFLIKTGGGDRKPQKGLFLLSNYKLCTLLHEHVKHLSHVIKYFYGTSNVSSRAPRYSVKE